MRSWSSKFINGVSRKVSATRIPRRLLELKYERKRYVGQCRSRRFGQVLEDIKKLKERGCGEAKEPEGFSYINQCKVEMMLEKGAGGGGDSGGNGM